MSKKKLTVCIILAGILLAAGSMFYPYRIPSMNVLYYKSYVKVVKCPLNWNTLFIRTAYSSVSPRELISTADPNPIPVYKNSVLSYRFDKKPDRVEVTIYQDAQEAYEVGSDNTIVVPDQGGAAIFVVVGYFPQGEVQYIFWVDAI